MIALPFYIHGAGPVALALALGAQRLGFTPRLIGALEKGQEARAWSLLPRTLSFLKALGVDVLGQRIETMRVWQADRGGQPLPGRLNFKGSKEAPISTVVPGVALNKALQTAAKDIPILATAPDDPLRALHLITQGRAWPLSLPQPRKTTWAYGQTALTGTVSVQGLGAEAWQVFLPEGPLALLPLPDGMHASMIWSVKDAALKGLRQRPDLAALTSKALGLELEFQAQDLYAFPLNAAHARAYVGASKGRAYALLGDAAHRVHPLAGVGLNLGLSDVGALLDALVQARRTGTDLTTLPALSPYERARRAENEALIATIDGLARLFGQDWGAVRALRGLGMGLVSASGLTQHIQSIMSDDRVVCQAIQTPEKPTP